MVSRCRPSGGVPCLPTAHHIMIPLPSHLAASTVVFTGGVAPAGHCARQPAPCVGGGVGEVAASPAPSVHPPGRGQGRPRGAGEPELRPGMRACGMDGPMRRCCLMLHACSRLPSATIRWPVPARLPAGRTAAGHHHQLRNDAAPDLRCLQEQGGAGCRHARGPAPVVPRPPELYGQPALESGDCGW